MGIPTPLDPILLREHAYQDSKDLTIAVIQDQAGVGFRPSYIRGLGTFDYFLQSTYPDRKVSSPSFIYVSFLVILFVMCLSVLYRLIVANFRSVHRTTSTSFNDAIQLEEGRLTAAQTPQFVIAPQLSTPKAASLSHSRETSIESVQTPINSSEFKFQRLNVYNEKPLNLEFEQSFMRQVV